MAKNLKGNHMQQQTLDLLMDLDQPLIGATSFYQSNPTAQGALTYRGFLELIKANREFFGDSVVIIHNEIFLRESFREHLDAWLPMKSPINLPKAA